MEGERKRERAGRGREGKRKMVKGRGKERGT